MPLPSRATLVRAVVAVPLVTALLVAVGTLGSSPSGPVGDLASPVAPPVTASRGVAALQEHLRAQPRDARSWASLGLGYLERARVSTDPSWYEKADSAFARSLAIQGADNDLALAGTAALAAARHDFATALRRSQEALAVNPASIPGLSARTDALTELGEYPEALAAAQDADRRRPGIASFSRLAYQFELRGDDARAAELLARVARDAASTSAFPYIHLADLARRAGRLTEARDHLEAGFRFGSDDPALAAGRARLLVAEGDLEGAAAEWARALAVAPRAEYLTEHGEVLLALGRPAQARAQFEIVEVTAQLSTAAGANPDLEVSRFLADHGEPWRALALARDEWSRRQSIHVADALAWALFRAGQPAAALPFAERATSLGTRDPNLLAHRGAIEAALGDRVAARRHLDAALSADPGWSPWQAREFGRMRDRLGGRS